MCDAHIHFFSKRYFDLLGTGVEPLADLAIEAPPAEPLQLAELWKDQLDKHGVARAALIASIPGDEGSVEMATEAFPDRFWGQFFVNPLAADAADRLAAVLGRGNLRVPCLFPAMHGYSLTDARVTALLDALAGTPKPVALVHCGVLSVGIRRKLGLPSRFDMRYSNPIDLHPVALRYPQIRFVVPHFGAGYFREALMLADLCPNIYFDTSSSNSWMRYQVPDIDLAAVFRKAVGVLGPQRLLFGTDSSFFPRGWNRAVYEQQAKAMQEAGLSEADQRAILGGNLESLLDG
ncbi:MAG: amidohydrolase family protein [Bryobacterales bacterium]|nr:amidohydrolase family protein [Bryobacterales bacterium]